MKETKRALVMSGGGSKGAFHAGYVRRRLGEQGVHYPIVCGVSVGSLAAGILTQFPEGKELEASQMLDDIFLSSTNADIWQSWFLFGRMAGLWKKSFLDSRPLRELIRAKLDPEAVRSSGKELRVGAVDLSTGRYAVMDQSYDPLDGALAASSAFPGFFLPVELEGHLWTDGGVQRVTPIKAAIQAGATSIDVVVASPQGAVPRFRGDPNALDVLLRSLEIMIDRLTWVDIDYALEVNKLVSLGAAPGKREIEIRVAAPDQELNEDSLNFDPTEAKLIASQGYQAAVDQE